MDSCDLLRNCAARDIAVITPYKAQQHEIRARLGERRGGGKVMELRVFFFASVFLNLR